MKFEKQTLSFNIIGIFQICENSKFCDVTDGRKNGVRRNTKNGRHGTF